MATQSKCDCCARKTAPPTEPIAPTAPLYTSPAAPSLRGRSLVRGQPSKKRDRPPTRSPSPPPLEVDVQPNHTETRSKKKKQTVPTMASHVQMVSDSSSEDRGPTKKRKRSKDNREAPPPARRTPTVESDQSSMEDNEESDDSWDDMVQGHAHSIQGNDNRSPNLYNAPISTQIPKKLQNKIIRNKYVNFADLLPTQILNHNFDELQHFQLKNTGSNISIVPTARKNKLQSIEQWSSAFIRFAAIYSAQYPLDTPALMKYGETVRDLADQHASFAWLRYDTNFRMLREHALMPWDTFHNEFWNKATTHFKPGYSSSHNQLPFLQQRRNSGPFTPYQKSGYLPYTQNSGPTQGFRYCYSFDRRGFCNKRFCNYPHICSICKGPHPKHDCRANTEQQAQHNTTNTTKSIPKSNQH